MRMKKNLLFVILLSGLGSSAQTTAPKYSNEFLSIGVGARSLSMSGACVSSVSDVSATYWNPAGLLLVPHNLQLGYMHSEYFAGIAKYDYAGGCFRLNDSSSLGISYIRFGVDDIPNTLELIDEDGNIRYDRIKSFSVSDNAFIFSYAKKSAIAGLHYGANVKIIHRIAGDFASAWGFGLDIGARYEYKKWLLGAMARDITSTFNAWSFNTEELEDVFILTGNEIPTNSLELTLPKLIAGASRKFHLYNKIGVLTELNADFTFDKKRNVLIKSDAVSIDPRAGIEISFKDMIFFRTGVGNFQHETDFDSTSYISFQPTIGLGIKIKKLVIDYAFTDIGDQSIALYSNIITISYSIDKQWIKE